MTISSQFFWLEILLEKTDWKDDDLNFSLTKKLCKENRELYGSVKTTEIAKNLEENEKIKINPSMIQPVKEIKSLGTYNVLLNLHTEIQSEIKITVLAKEGS